VKHFGQILLLLASLAFLPGATTSSCAFAELFGLETHHHTTSDVDCDSHEAPCDEDCLLDFGDANASQSDAESVIAVSEIPEFASGMLVTLPALEAAIDFAPPPQLDHSLQAHSPSSSGVFLI
jgi:hypothetical protein